MTKKELEILAGLLFAAIVIVAARLFWPSVTEMFWPWVTTQPRGAAAFLGTLAGAFFGLLAILGGALYNAKLNRDRDDRLRREAHADLLNAVRAEVKITLLFCNSRKKLLDRYERNPEAKKIDWKLRGPWLVEMLKVPVPKASTENLGKIGALGENVAGTLFTLSYSASSINFTVRNIAALNWPASFEGVQKNLRTLAKHTQQALDAIEKASRG